MLDVGEGNCVYWQLCGNPEGKPGTTPISRTRFLSTHQRQPDPSAKGYRGDLREG